MSHARQLCIENDLKMFSYWYLRAGFLVFISVYGYIWWTIAMVKICVFMQWYTTYDGILVTTVERSPRALFLKVFSFTFPALWVIWAEPSLCFYRLMETLQVPAFLPNQDLNLQQQGSVVIKSLTVTLGAIFFKEGWLPWTFLSAHYISIWIKPVSCGEP